MPRPSPFAGAANGPAADAVVVELGRPTRIAFGCFGATIVFLALIAVAALSFAVTGPHGVATAYRVIGVVVGIVFTAIVLGLIAVVVRAVRTKQGIAVDSAGVWWRGGEVVVRLPWTDVAAGRMVSPTVIRGLRTSTPAVPALELSPVDDEALRRYPELVEKITASEPVRPGLPSLRFTFRLPSVEEANTIGGAVARFAPDQWETGQLGE